MGGVWIDIRGLICGTSTQIIHMMRYYWGDESEEAVKRHCWLSGRVDGSRHCIPKLETVLVGLV